MDGYGGQPTLTTVTTNVKSHRDNAATYTRGSNSSTFFCNPVFNVTGIPNNSGDK